MVRGNNPNSAPNFFRDTLSPLVTKCTTQTKIRSLIKLLMNHHLLSSAVTCCTCRQEMSIISRNRCLDKFCWYVFMVKLFEYDDAMPVSVIWIAASAMYVWYLVWLSFDSFISCCTSSWTPLHCYNIQKHHTKKHFLQKQFVICVFWVAFMVMTCPISLSLVSVGRFIMFAKKITLPT